MAIVSLNSVEDCIYLIRGHRVMLDRDLAKLYGVTTGNLNLAVQRNQKRFPDDFMFQLTLSETKNLKLQIARSSSWGGRRHLPYAFTEQGVAMLSGVLHSDRAVEVNIAIMRVFVRMRHLLSSNQKLATKLQELENKLIAHDYQIEDVMKVIRRLMHGPQKHKPKIGYLV